MNWAAVGAIGEVAGAIAVVVTLVYLAKQIRISAEATKAMVRQGVTDATVAYLALEIDPRELREVTRKFWDRGRERPVEQRNWPREFAERVDELRDRAQAQLDKTGPRPRSV